ncbi:alpha/beta hydrolase fold domain-containing protein [Streptomyces flaveolus]|uniref:alpha/beta hydrolase fold domain-containing protein n=1 Tax=Streptomyces flaveolus TaxID=67297 RepID=UPI0033336F1D
MQSRKRPGPPRARSVAVRRSPTALPFLPRIRYRHAILPPARWKLPAAAQPAGPFTAQRHTTLTERARTWRCPPRPELHDDDHSISVDLAEPPHARTSTCSATSTYAVPMKAASLRGSPPALVLTAEVDPLRDDAEAYAERLRHDGVPTTARRHSGVFHGFFTEVGVFAKTDEAIDDGWQTSAQWNRVRTEVLPGIAAASAT